MPMPREPGDDRSERLDSIRGAYQDLRYGLAPDPLQRMQALGVGRGSVVVTLRYSLFA